MTQGKYVELSVAQRTDVWRRWKAGESLHTIGRAFDRPHTSIHCLLAMRDIFRNTKMENDLKLSSEEETSSPS
jgi:hypothetical protein